MNGHFGQLRQSFKALLVNNLGIVARSTPYTKLEGDAIGAFAADVYNSKGEPVSLASPTFKTHKRLILRQGVPRSLGSNNPTITRTDHKHRTTIEFTKDDVVGWRGKKGQKGSVGDIIAFGYDGIDASKDIARGVALDAKPLFVNLRFSGEPIKRFFGHNHIDYKLPINKDLCIDDCDCFDPCGKVNGELIADKILKKIETDYLYTSNTNIALGQIPLRNLVKAHKIKKCATGVTLPSIATTTYKKWSIIVPLGTPGVLAKLVQNSPSIKIFYDGISSKGIQYSAYTANSVTSLPDLVLTDLLLPICDTCPDCPIETTTVNGIKTIQVRVHHGDTVPTVQIEDPTDPEETIPLELAPATLVTSDIFDGDVYLITFAKTADEAVILEGIGEDAIVNVIGDSATYCTGGSQTYEWGNCETLFTTKKSFQLVLPNHHCDKEADRLEEVQAAYPDLIISVSATGTCITAYTAEIESNKLPQEDCDREFGLFTFEKPASYEGFPWTEGSDLLEAPTCTPVEEDEKPCCVTGIVFETARWDEGLNECGYGYTSWSPTLTKPVRLQINIHSTDYSDSACVNDKTYFTVLQKATYEKGTDGRLVQEWEKIQLSSENPNGWTLNPIVNQALGWVSVVDPNAIYDTYYLTLKRKVFGKSYAFDSVDTITYCFPIISGNGKDFESYMNELVLSTGNRDLSAVIL